MATYLDRLGGLANDLAYKAPCRVATTANVAMLGLGVIDGVQLEDRDRVLVWQQSDQTQNGIRVAQSGAWPRAIDFSNTSGVVRGTLVTVTDGALYGDLVFELVESGVIFETTGITFAVFVGSAPPTGGILLSQLWQGLASRDPNGTVEQAFPSPGAPAYGAVDACLRGGRLTVGDALYQLIATTLGYNPTQMANFYAFCQAFPINPTS